MLGSHVHILLQRHLRSFERVRLSRKRFETALLLIAGVVLGQLSFLKPRRLISSQSKCYLMISGCGVLLVSVASQMAGIAYGLNAGLRLSSV